MNTLKRTYLTLAGAALIAVPGGCNHPETVPPSQPATVRIVPAATNARQAVTDPPVLFKASQPIGTVTEATVDVVSVPAESPHSQFIASMEEELKTMDANIAVLKQRVANIKPDARVQAESDLATLRQKYQYTSDQLESLKQQMGDAWDNAKASFLHVMQTLNDAYKDLEAEFTEDGVI